jgi:hypothetical protein
MVVSLKQRGILHSLFKQYIETGVIKTFVPTKGVTTVTMRSLLKTGYIETDKAIKGIPSNMRLTQKGIEAMEKYTNLRRNTIDGIIYRNKSKIDMSYRATDKVSELAFHLNDSKITITDLGYGLFSVRKNGGEESYYEVYTLDEYCKVHPSWAMCSTAKIHIKKVVFNEENF